MRHLPWREAAWGLVLLVVLLALYVGAYLASVERRERINPGGPISFVPEYRFGGDAAKAAFGAVHELDRALREDYWEGRDLFRDEAP